MAEKPKSSGQAIRILLLEDNPADAALALRKVKEAGFQPIAEVARTAPEFKQRATAQPHDIILGDYRLPNWTGLEAIRWLRSSEILTPFIFVTGTLGDELAIECIKAGADEYVLKENLGRLPVAIKRSLEHQQLRLERDWAETELRESEKQYRLLFHANPYPMWVYDEETLRFLAVNAAAIRHYGYSASEFFSMTVKNIQSPNEVSLFVDSVQRDRKEGSREHYNELWKHRKKDGTNIHVEISSQPIAFRAAKARLVLAHDVTERQKFEQQFRHTQKMEVLGRLAGGVAHDFNNLLMVIDSHAQLIREHPRRPAKIQQYTTQIMNAVDRAALLTRQLLVFSRKQPQDRRVLDLNNLVVEFCKMLPVLLGKDVSLEVLRSADECLIYSDRSQIEQVIMNLVVNARDAMPTGGKLTIETATTFLDGKYFNERTLDVKAGNYVLLAVTDTGVGMDKGIQSQIFDPFFTTKEPGKGTGLGLSTVYGIVKQDGGYIWAYSEMGKGTTFKVYLPCAEAEVEVEAAPLKPVEEIETGGGETVLLVEDEAGLRAATVEFLESKGYCVLQASDAAEALRISSTHKAEIDLLLTDVVMPGLGGVELAAAIAECRPKIRVVYMSGYTEQTSGTAGIHGSRLFLQKPFSLSRLAATLRRALESGRGKLPELSGL